MADETETGLITQDEIDHLGRLQRERLTEVYREVTRLGESCDWMGGMIDAEAEFNYNCTPSCNGSIAASSGEVSAFEAYARGQIYPGFTACAYINLTQLRDIRARSRAFCLKNPYWKGIQHNIKTHAIGKGHVYVAASKDPTEKAPKDLLRKVQDVIDEFLEVNDYRRVQGEKLDRQGRDGEYILRFYEADDILRVRFVEPLLVWDPPGKSLMDDVWFGMQFAGDYESPKGYYIKPTNYFGTLSSDDGWATMVPADEIQHRTVNVDKSSPRGLPTTYWVQEQLTQALKTLKSMGTLVDIRSRIALIRKRVNSVAGTVQTLLSKQAAAQLTGAGGDTRNIYQFSPGSIIDTNDQAIYEMPGQNIDTDKIVCSLQADLRVPAAALGLAEYMTSADCSTTSFANGMVAEGPVVKTFESIQQDLIDDDLRVLKRAIRLAIRVGILPGDTLRMVKIEVQPPSLVGRNRIQDAQANQIENEKKVISRRTWALRDQLDPDEERAQIEKEDEEDLERAKAMAAIEQPKTPGGDTFQQRKNQPKTPGKVTARPGGVDKQQAKEDVFVAAFDQSGTPVWVNAEPPYTVYLREASPEDSQQKPTGEDMAMAAVLITPEWLSRTKSEILGLPASAKLPRDQVAVEQYEPGVPGQRLGIVDGQEVWAVDMRAVMVKHNSPDVVVAGNSERWPFLPANRIIVDWSFEPRDRACDILHEVVEQLLMSSGKWAYARAHRLANQVEMDWLLELRPELAAMAVVA